MSSQNLENLRRRIAQSHNISKALKAQAITYEVESILPFPFTRLSVDEFRQQVAKKCNVDATRLEWAEKVFQFIVKDENDLKEWISTLVLKCDLDELLSQSHMKHVSEFANRNIERLNLKRMKRGCNIKGAKENLLSFAEEFEKNPTWKCIHSFVSKYGLMKDCPDADFKMAEGCVKTHYYAIIEYLVHR